MTGNSNENHYFVVTIKPWHVEAFQRHAAELPGQWHLITEREGLSFELVRQYKPRYLFFPHWSWRVPEEILQEFECVCFHMTDVPYGRGGSPLQNLIARGHKETRLTALRMERELDSGPVYMKRALSLQGSGQQIFQQSAELIYEMIAKIIQQEPQPTPQQGEPVIFQRRTPEQSVLPEQGELQELYDHIRMLDIDTYPHAFIEYGDYRLEFSSASLADDTLEAKVTITRRK